MSLSDSLFLTILGQELTLEAVKAEYGQPEVSVRVSFQDHDQAISSKIRIFGLQKEIDKLAVSSELLQ
jgi:hypothetical protein